MRDIQKYTSDYECMDDPANRFETEYQVVYRRKKVLEELKRHQQYRIIIFLFIFRQNLFYFCHFAFVEEII